MSFYGIPRLRLVRDDIDLVGIRHLEVAQMWQAESPAQSIDAVLSQRPSAPSVANMLLIASSTIPKDGGMETRWTFEGYSDDPAEPFRTYGESTQWDFEPGFQETSLLFLPNWSTLETAWHGTVDSDGQISWDPFLSGGAGGTGLGAASDSGNQTPNPMYGYQTYFSMATGAWTYRWADIELKPSFYQGVGTIVPAGQIPGNPPDFSALGQGTRNWLKLPPKFRKRGSIYEFVGTWWLSSDSGWPVPVYAGTGAQGEYAGAPPSTQQSGGGL
jgi:hypothetical protein